MWSRIKNWLAFQFEQLVMRGPVAQIAVALALMLLVALVGGFLIRHLVSDFESLGAAVWWAFEHVVVPEYVDHDDQDVIKRAVATVLIVVGSILFAGSVIAILAQWLAATRERLELGLTRVALDAHIVLLDWTSRTPAILKGIAVSHGRVERFLRQRGVRRLRLALLAEHVDAALRQQIRIQLAEHWNARQIVLRAVRPWSSTRWSGSTSRSRRLPAVGAARPRAASPGREAPLGLRAIAGLEASLPQAISLPPRDRS